MNRLTAEATKKHMLKLIDEAYDLKAWHGPNLRGSLRGINAREAARRVGPKRHNIHELVLHAAYWKYAARRRILGEKRGSFGMKGSNWIASPGPLTPRRWKSDLALLAETHRRLRSTVAGLRSSDLDRMRRMIAGTALHDVYHAGQIQLLKRLMAR